MKQRLAHIGLIRVKGADAKTFLQGQVTCDMNDVTETHSILGAYLNQKGRIIATFRISLWQDSYFLSLPIDALPLLLQSLNKYALFSKVVMSDVSTEFRVLGVTDLTPNASATLKVIKLAEDRFEVLATHDEINAYYTNLNTPEADANYWDTLDIDAGIPSIYQATLEQFLPHQINYDVLGVSFKKGCYLGQEIVARMHYRGQAKQHLYKIEITGQVELKIGMPLHNASTNREIGELVMFVRIADDHFKALAVLNDEQAVSQTILINGTEAQLNLD